MKIWEEMVAERYTTKEIKDEIRHLSEKCDVEGSSDWSRALMERIDKDNKWGKYAEAE